MRRERKSYAGDAFIPGLEQIKNMNRNHRPNAGLLSLTVDSSVIDILDRLAADHLVSRTQMIRKLLIGQLQAMGELPANTPVMPRKNVGAVA